MSEGSSEARRVDVAVLGGGIAGAAACLGLLRQGITPLWFAPPETGDKPGEHLAPAASTVLKSLDALALLEHPAHREAHSMLSAWGSSHLAERNAIVHLEGPGMVLNRRAFEADLRRLAVSRGTVLVEEKAEAIATEKTTGRPWHLRSGAQTWRARFAVDATGRAAVLARNYAGRFRSDQLAALVAFLDQDPDSDVAPTQATLIEAVRDGWWYAALLADGRLVLNYYTDPDLLPEDATRSVGPLSALLAETDYIGRWIAEAGFQLTAPPKLHSAGTIWTAPAAGPGWAAVGDAAAGFDPLSSHGMTTALWTGAAAAEAIPTALAGDDAPIRRYVEQVASGVQDLLESRTKIYAMEQRFKDRPFWQRRLLAQEGSR